MDSGTFDQESDPPHALSKSPEDSPPLNLFDTSSVLNYSQISTKPTTAKFKYQLSVTSPFLTHWEGLVTLLAVWNCFYVPFEVAFISEQPPIGLIVVDIAIDFAYFLDVVLYARSTYIDAASGEEVTDSERILRKYVYSGKFIVDLISAVPFDIVSIVTSQHEALQFLRLLKVVRLLRIRKIVIFLQKNSAVTLRLQLILLFFLYVIFIHVVTCLWFLITKTSQEATTLHGMEGEVLATGSLFGKYAFSLYVTLSAAEFGWKTEWERMFMGLVQLVGQMFKAYMFGEIFVALFNLKRKNRLITNFQNATNTTMVNMKLESTLRAKISAFLVSNQSFLIQQVEIQTLFSAIPPSLKQEVRSFLFADIIARHPVLADDEQVATTVLRRLTNVYCQPEQKIVSHGEVADALFFIATGKCAVWVMDEFSNPFRGKTLKAGTHFGEIALIFPTHRTATVVALDFATLAVLGKHDFLDICRTHPKAWLQFKRTASSYRDRWQMFNVGTLRRCPFFRKLATELLSEVVYRLPTERIESNAYIYTEDQVADKIIFVIDGSVEVYAAVQDSRLKISTTDEHFSKSFSRDEINRLEFHREVLAHQHDKPFSVKIGMDDLGMGSVICANMILLGGKVNMYAKATRTTIVKTLSIQLLSTLCEEFQEVMQAVRQQKDKILREHKYARIRQIQMTVLDYRKSCAFGSSQLWRAKMKVRRRVLGKVIEQREIRSKGIFNVFHLSQRLRAILEAEQRSDFEMVEKIHRGIIPKFSKEVYLVLEMLHLGEVGYPILSQFALESVKLHDYVANLRRASRRLRERMKMLDREKHAYRKNLKEMQELVDLGMRLVEWEKLCKAQG